MTDNIRIPTVQPIRFNDLEMACRYIKQCEIDGSIIKADPYEFWAICPVIRTKEGDGWLVNPEWRNATYEIEFRILTDNGAVTSAQTAVRNRTFRQPAEKIGEW